MISHWMHFTISKWSSSWDYIIGGLSLWLLKTWKQVMRVRCRQLIHSGPRRHSSVTGESKSCSSTSANQLQIKPSRLSKMPLQAIYALGQSSPSIKPFRRRHLGQVALKALILFPFLFSVVLGIPSRNLKFLSEAHFEFSIDLYRQIANHEVGNIVMSPQNINLGLAMLFLGTTSNTSSSTELRRALHYENMSYVDIHKAHQQILGVLADPYYAEQDFLSKVCLFES